MIRVDPRTLEPARGTIFLLVRSAHAYRRARRTRSAHTPSRSCVVGHAPSNLVTNASTETSKHVTTTHIQHHVASVRQAAHHFSRVANLQVQNALADNLLNQFVVCIGGEDDKLLDEVDELEDHLDDLLDGGQMEGMMANTIQAAKMVAPAAWKASQDTCAEFLGKL